jgi:(p)ppGpp synthase/HD superfamily hydrolase
MTDKSFSPHFADALSLAARLHRHQLRKGVEIPYISHLLAVAAIAIESGADEDEAIAALLHDAIEDAPDTLGPHKATAVRSMIGTMFGRRVLDIVEACTDSDTDPKPPWVSRKEHYIASIAHKPAPAVLVGMSDKIHNARAIRRDFRRIGDAVWDRFNKDAGKTGTLGYYRGLADAYRARAAKLSDPRLIPMVDELERAVESLETVAGQKGVWPIVASRSA